MQWARETAPIFVPSGISNHYFIDQMRIALSLEYDGSGFCGWQSQPSRCGVQDAIEAALSQIAAHPVQAQCAGRTDAGVHALSQVVHFDTCARRPLTAWVRGVNMVLPKTIAVHWARSVSDEFHARNRATGRRYVYLLLNRSARPALHSARIGWYHRPLKVERMRQAMQLLVGRHDFSAFRAAECQALSPLKELRQASVQQRGELVLFEFAADAFLHHMVRNLVGCLVKIGDGTRPVSWAAELLASRDRRLAASTFPPDGLYLAAVDYDPRWGLPERKQCLPAELVLASDLFS